MKQQQQEEELLKNEFEKIFSNENWKRRGFYTKKELAFFKKLILFKISSTEECIKNLRDNLGLNSQKVDPSFKGISDIDEVIYENPHIMRNQENFLRGLKGALTRFEQGLYDGKSYKTGKIIPPKRLFAVPHTTFLVEEKMKV